MSRYLLDTNLLIALLWPKHQQHDLAQRWIARHRSRGWATCALTQAGFVRIVSNPAFSRDAIRVPEALRILSENTKAVDHEFWAMDNQILNVVAFAGVRLVGHQQVTDAYLLGLAISRGGTLVTLDRGITSLTEEHSVERRALEVLI